MEFTELLEIIQDEPAFATSWSLSSEVNPREIYRQLSRWSQAGMAASRTPGQEA